MIETIYDRNFLSFFLPYSVLIEKIVMVWKIDQPKLTLASPPLSHPHTHPSLDYHLLLCKFENWVYIIGIIEHSVYLSV